MLAPIELKKALHLRLLSRRRYHHISDWTTYIYFPPLDDDSAPAAPAAATPAPAAAPAETPRSTRGRGNAQAGAASRSGRYYKRGGAPVPTGPDADGFTQANPNEAGQRFDRDGACHLTYHFYFHSLTSTLISRCILAADR